MITAKLYLGVSLKSNQQKKVIEKMVKKVVIKNAIIDSANKGIKKTEPLSEAEYTTLAKKLKSTKKLYFKFGDEYKSDVIICKIPDNADLREYNKNGRKFWRIGLVSPFQMEDSDSNYWVSLFIDDETEAEDLILEAGSSIAIVCKVVEKEITDSDGNKKKTYNLKKVRGYLVIETPESKKKAKDNFDIESEIDGLGDLGDL